MDMLVSGIYSNPLERPLDRTIHSLMYKYRHDIHQHQAMLNTDGGRG